MRSRPALSPRPSTQAHPSGRTTVSEPLGIALIGCGTVGGGVARLLLEQPERLAARAGRRLELRRVVVRDPARARAVPLPAGVVTTDLGAVLRDPGVQAAVERRGVAGIDATDIRFAGELGYTVKLLAEAWQAEGLLALHVSPVLLRRLSPLAQVRGAYNAVAVTGDAVGDTLYYGRGAGQMPTASAVVADLIDLAVGRGQRTFQTLRMWSDGGPALKIRPPATVRSRFYLRLLVEDRPGVLAEVAHVLAEHQVSISSLIQHEAPEEHEGERVQLVIMTHTVPT